MAHYALLESSNAQWVEFVHTHPEASIFHHPAWSELMHECYGFRPFVLAIVDQSGKLRAGLPFLDLKSRLTGHRWISLPFSDHCSPLYTDADSLEQLTDSLIELAQDKQTPNLFVRWNLPARPQIASYSHYVIHQVPLDGEAMQQSKRLDKMHRRNIRVARKHKITIQRGTDLKHMELFYQLQLETRHRKGLPVQPWCFFRLLQKLILDQGLGFVQLAYQGRDLLGGIVCFHWQKMLMLKYAASRKEALSLRPNNLLFWHAICWGRGNGYRTLDLGRSDVDNIGLREFKSRWGAVEHPLTYSAIAAPAPEKSNGRLMKPINIVLRHSPLWVSRVSGELLYKHFG